MSELKEAEGRVVERRDAPEDERNTLIRPLGSYVVVKRAEAMSITKGGIMLPDSAQIKPNEGVVVAAGPGSWHGDKLVPVGCKVGDRVAYVARGAIELNVDTQHYFVLGENGILAILERVG